MPDLLSSSNQTADVLVHLGQGLEETARVLEQTRTLAQQREAALAASLDSGEAVLAGAARTLKVQRTELELEGGRASQATGAELTRLTALTAQVARSQETTDGRLQQWSARLQRIAEAVAETRRVLASSAASAQSAREKAESVAARLQENEAYLTGEVLTRIREAEERAADGARSHRVALEELSASLRDKAAAFQGLLAPAGEECAGRLAAAEGQLREQLQSSRDALRKQLEEPAERVAGELQAGGERLAGTAQALKGRANALGSRAASLADEVAAGSRAVQELAGLNQPLRQLGARYLPG